MISIYAVPGSSVCHMDKTLSPSLDKEDTDLKKEIREGGEGGGGGKREIINKRKILCSCRFSSSDHVGVAPKK